MKKIIPLIFATLLYVHSVSNAQSLPTPAHIVIVLEENKAYEEIMGDSSADAPFINSLPSDTDAALFTQYYALIHPSQPNYLMLFSGFDHNVNGDDITTTQFTDCNLGASLLSNGYSFKGYSEEEPSVGYLGDTYDAYARKHNPWSNWQGSSSNAIPDSCNAPYTLFPTNYDLLPTVSFVIPDLNDDMHNGSIADGDTWLKNNLTNYITWAKSNNSLFVLTFDEDDDNHNNHITTIFIGPMVKGGSYADTTIHYDVLRTIENMYGLPDYCGYSDSTDSSIPITKIWRGNNTTGINQLPVNNNQLTIYPNPTNGLITITSAKNIDEIKVTNVLGQLVYEAQPEQTLFNFELQDAGMYFITATSGNATTTRKIVVSK